LRCKQRESNVGTSDSDLFFDICLKISDGAPICRRMETENWQLSATIYSPQNYDIFFSKDVELLHNLSEMKKKSNDMSFDMFNDAMSSTSIPVFTNANDATKNDTPKVPEVPFTKVPEASFDGNRIQNELIKIDFDKQTVSARALYEFFELEERFSIWCKRMFSYGLVENVDFTTVGFRTVVKNGGTKEIGDYLLTIDAAKHIAMVQRTEKGFQARNYFINIEKLYLKSIFSKQTVEVSTPLLENFKNLLVQLETEMSQQQQLQKNYDHLVEKTVDLENQVAQQNLLQKKIDSLVDKTVVLEKQMEQHNLLQDLKQIYIKQKVDRALTDGFTEVDNIVAVDKMVEPLSRIGNSGHLKIANSLPPIYQMWYSELSDVFSTTDAERIGLKYDISRTTIFRILKNQISNIPLFRKLRYGKYEKMNTDFK
jgi:phage anti-repressor protein